MEKLRQIIREEIKSILEENTERDLEKALKSHDWTYEYSDDHTVYKRGKAEREHIYDLISNCDPKKAERLWKKYAPKGVSFPKNISKLKEPITIKKTEPKYEKRFKKGDRVLVEGTADKTPLYSRYIGKIVKIDGWEERKPLNTFYAIYEVKVEKVFSKNQKELDYEGKTIKVFDFNIIGKK